MDSGNDVVQYLDCQPDENRIRDVHHGAGKVEQRLTTGIVHPDDSLCGEHQTQGRVGTQNYEDEDEDVLALTHHEAGVPLRLVYISLTGR